jgi:DNA-binding MarR family transcriptional regulator
MSTSFTNEVVTPAGPAPVRPQLGQLLMHGQQWVTTSLLGLMVERGHDRLTAAHLMFLNNLDCGVTHASEVARRMGVSRQAVYRTTRELQGLGILELEVDPQRRTQKIIRMTPEGQRAVTDARQCLDEIEEVLRRRLGDRDLDRLAAILGRDWGPALGG